MDVRRKKTQMRAMGDAMGYAMVSKEGDRDTRGIGLGDAGGKKGCTGACACAVAYAGRELGDNSRELGSGYNVKLCTSFSTTQGSY
ncbi:unnamed protein product [Ilex paraguariensis]|uniref:Uncharacterized protein n=1 Tax=Ilex paraguariensis TaxID=185542 RepID=A0ABC8RIF1_9AQUA